MPQRKQKPRRRSAAIAADSASMIDRITNDWRVMAIGIGLLIYIFKFWEIWPSPTKGEYSTAIAGLADRQSVSKLEGKIDSNHNLEMTELGHVLDAQKESHDDIRALASQVGDMKLNEQKMSDEINSRHRGN